MKLRVGQARMPLVFSIILNINMARVALLARVGYPPGAAPASADQVAAISESLHSVLGVECVSVVACPENAILLRCEVAPELWDTIRSVRDLWVGALQLPLSLEKDHIFTPSAASSPASLLLQVVGAAADSPPPEGAPSLLADILNPRLAARSLRLTHLSGQPTLQLSYTTLAAAAGSATSVNLGVAAADLCSIPHLVLGHVVRLKALMPSAESASAGRARAPASHHSRSLFSE